MYSLSVLPSGLRVLTAPSDGTESVTVLLLAGAGSRYETADQRGVSHFLEHMFFKGGKSYPTPADVAGTIDGRGGEFNAFTGKEYAGYYVKIASSHLSTACDVLSDMLLRATFREEEIDRERGVIIEEYRMYQDTPMYQAGWDFEELLYGDQPLGWDTIGTEACIRSFHHDHFVEHHRQLYTSENAVLCFAGRIQQDRARALAEEMFSDLPRKRVQRFTPIAPGPATRVKLTTKKTEQAHLVLGCEGVSALDPDHFAMRLLAIVLGGNMSSRMFLRVREARGLCYYIQTTTDNYLDTGVLSTRAGVDPARLEEAITAIRHEYLEIAKNGTTIEELTRAKEYLKGKLTLSLEDSEERAHFFGKQALLYPEILDPAQYLMKIEAVTKKQVDALAKKLFSAERLKLVVIGSTEDRAGLEKLLSGT